MAAIKKRIRIPCSLTNPSSVIDDLTNAIPAHYAGNDVDFELAIFSGEDLQAAADISLITFQIKALGGGGGAPAPGSTALMQVVVVNGDLDADCDADSWNEGTKQQAVVSFAADDVINAAGTYWLVVAITDQLGNTSIAAAGNISIKEDGFGSTDDPEPIDNYLDASVGDTRYPLRSPANGNYRINGAVLQLIDPDTGLWHDLFVDTNNGTEPPRLRLADVGEA
ncbi:hypothetical protein [Cerasicoccus frondis]|uniref:hypothetical protein n=1 Tax=Cerasicoccus frondis TaxID=490090 RepID=UPI0028529CBF|nr:hypothetical protein [Cerasicoccus frondis]